MPVFSSFTASGATIKNKLFLPVHGQMDVAQIDIGQGDCTLISCPNDQVILLDCGSVGGMPVGGLANVRAMLRAWANGNNVDVILSHPDQDHYNQLLNVVIAPAAVGVNNLYFSMALNAASPLGYYYATLLGANLPFLQNPNIHEITLNAAAQTRTTWDNTNGYAAPTAVAVPILATGFVVASGVSAGTAWSVKIIAGNVPAIGNHTLQSNAASLVTLVTFGAQTALLMADSTPETMNYLLANQAAQIANVRFFQMPHHGSESNLPPVGFAALVDPAAITISVGLLNDGFRLPRRNAINAWTGGANLQPAALQIDDWVVGAPGYLTYNDLLNIPVLWAPYPTLQNGSGTFFWLANPADAGPAFANTGFYGFTNNGYFLYRRTILHDIWATGVEGDDEHNL